MALTKEDLTRPDRPQLTVKQLESMLARARVKRDRQQAALDVTKAEIDLIDRAIDVTTGMLPKSALK